MKQDESESGIFSYTYSASDQKEIEEIRRKYQSGSENKMETLRQLDQRVQASGKTISRIVIALSATLLVVGIILIAVQTALSGIGWVAAILGLIGLFTAYPLRRMLSGRAKKKYADKILRLTYELSNRKS